MFMDTWGRVPTLELEVGVSSGLSQPAAAFGGDDLRNEAQDAIDLSSHLTL